MMNHKRRFSVTDRYSLEEVADKLAEMSWCLCNGFLVDGLLLLNDAFSEDGAQEFAIFQCNKKLAELEASPTSLNMIETITASWMKKHQIYRVLCDLIGKPIPAEGTTEYAALLAEGLVGEEPKYELLNNASAAVIVATSATELRAALSDKDFVERKVLCTNTITLHPSSESCRLCA